MRWPCAGASDFTTVRLGLGGWRSGGDLFGAVASSLVYVCERR